MGTVQLRGAGLIDWVWLPAGTLKVKGETVCASSAAFRLSHASISTERMIKASAAQCRAWISHIAISAHRSDMNGKRAHLQPSKPLSLDPPRNKQGN